MVTFMIKKQRKSPIYFSVRKKQAMYVCLLVLLISGILWLIFNNFVRIDGDFGPQHHPVEPWFLKIHSIAMFGYVFILGTLWPIHMKLGLKMENKKNKITGLILLITSIILVITGYGLFYVGSDLFRSIISITHWIIGIGLGVVFLIHSVKALNFSTRISVKKG